MQNTVKYSIYTDGSCLKNPGGPGGWAFIGLKDNIEEILGYGVESSTTNNRMELMAVIQALDLVEKLDGVEYIIHTDSQWVMKCATGEWRRKANTDLWLQYDAALGNRKIKYIWVKAHNGDKYNEIVDKIARDETKTINYKK